MTTRHDSQVSNGVGVLGATAIGIGGMVGGGIFAVLGVAAVAAGGATPVAFLIGGVIAALTAVSYSRLSVAMPSAGGSVSFIDGVFGVGQVTGTLNAALWVGYLATTALYASAFGHYSQTLLPGSWSGGGVLRLLIVVAVAAPWLVNLADASLIARAEGVIVAIKLLILAVVVAAGAGSVDTSGLAPSSWPGAGTIVGAAMLIFVAYEGFELIANASEDVRNPAHTLPRAFALSIAIVIVLYVLIAGVVVGSLTPEVISQSQDFALAEAAATTLGQAGFRLVGGAAILATLSAVNATLYGAARLSFTLATEGELPERFEHLRWNQPIGLHVTAIGGTLIAVALPLSSISGLASAIFLLVFAAVNAAAYRAQIAGRWRRPLAATGAAGCLGSLGVLLVRAVTHDRTMLVSLVILLTVAVAAEHRILRHRRTGPHLRVTSAGR